MRTSSTDELYSDVGGDRDSTPAPLLVSGHLDAWWCWAAVGLAVIFGAVATTAVFLRHPLRFGFSAVSLLAAAGGVVGFVIQIWRRRWLTWSGDSLQVTGRGTALEILDTEVEALAVTREYRHAVGRIVAEAHRLWVWRSPGEPRVLAFEARGMLGEPSPLAPLVERLQQRLEKKALEELRREGTLERPAWSWQDGAVVTVSSGKRSSTRVTGMSAVDNDIVELRIWVASDPLPAVRLPQSGQDVWLVGRMLHSTVGAPGDPGVAPAEGLGRILHESRPRSAAIMATMLCGMSTVVAMLAVFGAVLLRLTPLAILGAGTGMGAIMLGSTARRLWQCAFRLHETGISQRSLTGDRALRFSEIDQFVFDARRQYSKGRYLGTLFTMVFASDRQPKQGILHTERSAYETDEIAQVRDFVSEEIAAAMAARLVSSGELVWTRELTIQGGALHCQPRRFLRWKPRPASADIDSIRGYDISEGWFYVWTMDRDRPLFKVRTTEPNFYPGLLVFEQLLERTETVTGRRG
ncbi:hypothetical protein Pan44_30950 [Caulifigura coniformis]|uniref:Uncharacterized protein n=1 Tax=Caulifigura coniformis TaxID=2527983 RepID=A0A517SG07_9PLAN|nr:hypothetical protein [Caulifigura coniformis]QDT55054.1 hypothetical protein Pan44_30950 [Caulifigura coniformis]